MLAFQASSMIDGPLGRRRFGITSLALACTLAGCRRRHDDDRAPDGLGPPKTRPRDHDRAPPAPRLAGLERLELVDDNTLIATRTSGVTMWNVRERRQLWHVDTPTGLGTGVSVRGYHTDVVASAKRVVAVEKGSVVVRGANGEVEASFPNAWHAGFGPNAATLLLVESGALVLRRISDRATLQSEPLDDVVVRGVSLSRRLCAIRREDPPVGKRRSHRGTLGLLDAATGAVKWSEVTVAGAVVFSNDEQAMVARLEDGSLGVIDVGSLAIRARLAYARQSFGGHKVEPEAFAPLVFARGVVVAAQDSRTMVTYDATSGERKSFFTVDSYLRPRDKVAFTPDGAWALALGDGQTKLTAVHLAGASLLPGDDVTPELPDPERPLFGKSPSVLVDTDAIAISPDARTIAFGGRLGLFVFERTSLRRVATRLEGSA